MTINENNFRCKNCGREIIVGDQGPTCPYCTRQERKDAARKSVPVTNAAPERLLLQKELTPETVERLRSHHRYLRGNFEFMKSVPGLLEGERQWKQFVAVADFLQKNIAEHFQLEDEVLFPHFLDKASGEGNNELVAHLKEEHVSILANMGTVMAAIGTGDSPVSQEEIGRIFALLQQIRALMLEHTAKEDDKILSVI